MAGKDYNIAKKTVQDEILEAVNSMKTNLSGELTANVVKSIQGGKIAFKANDVEITISEVNPDKCVVHLHGAYANLSFVSITSTKLTVNNSYGYDSVGSYQIIEYY